MTREGDFKEEGRIAVNKYARELGDYTFGEGSMVEMFVLGANYADQHPKKGLWDAEKVVKWILNNYGTYEQLYTDNSGNHTYSDFQIGQFIRKLRKAMEK